MSARIPFAEATTEKLLFKTEFDKLSVQQQMILKAVYGQPLNEEELRYWSAFSGQGIYDDLGYLQEVVQPVPYDPQEYGDVTLIVGRRSGKTDKITSFGVAYEALCGGHKERVGASQQPMFLQIAQDLNTARLNLKQFIYQWLDSSPIGKQELSFHGASAITADNIKLKNALIAVAPPNIKVRGQAIACCAMDELCVWSKDRDASNPDSEVERAVTPALMQFYPFDKLLKVSTPMTEEGLLWKANLIGTKGIHLTDPTERAAHKRRLVLTAPTAAMGNPKVSRAYLIEQRAKDAEAFPREYLAQFAKSVSGFLSADLLSAAITQGVRSRPPQPGQFYVATLDPAFRRDAFAFTIGHMEGGKFVQDWLQAWRGEKDGALRPGIVLDQIASVCGSYGVRVVTSDQYHSESLMELAMTRGMVIEAAYLTNELKQRMWGDFNSLLHQGKLALLDSPELRDELLKMERVITKFGNTQYYGKRDDMAMVTALCVYKAMQMGEPRTAVRQTQKTQLELVRERVQRRAKQDSEDGGCWWAN